MFVCVRACVFEREREKERGREREREGGIEEGSGERIKMTMRRHDENVRAHAWRSHRPTGRDHTRDDVAFVKINVDTRLGKHRIS